MYDLYPNEVYEHLWVENVFNEIAESFGYEPYSTPILEPIEIYLKKSSRELVEEQSYHLKDRGGRELVLRPEITPSLSRMVSNFYMERSKPFRFYTNGLCYRYERPQKGRLREFKQINFDFLGGDAREMDMEVFVLIASIMKRFSVPKEQYEIRYNFRNVLSLFLKKLEIENPKDLLNLIDKKNKMETAAFDEALEAMLKSEQKDAILRFLDYKDAVAFVADMLEEEESLLNDLQDFARLTKSLDINLTYSPSTVRGLDYYTGLVFEVYDASSNIRRSLFGGGRYDGLLQNYVKDPIESCGFAIGFDIFLLFLKEKNLIPKKVVPDSCKVFYLEDQFLEEAVCVSQKLREELKIRVTTQKHKGSVQKIFSKLTENDQYLVIIGENEANSKRFVLKNLKTREEKTLSF